MRKKILSLLFWGSIGASLIAVVGSSLATPNHRFQRQISNSVLQAKSDVKQNVDNPSGKSIDPKNPLEYLDIQGGVVNGFVSGFQIPDNFELVIPAVDKDGKPVTKIADSAFCNYSGDLEEISYSDYSAEKVVKTHHVSAKEWQSQASHLTGLSISDSVTEIGDFAFCYNYFNHITFGKKISTIGMFAFYDVSNLASLTLPESLVNIGYGAFYKVTGIKNLLIPSKVKSIGGRAFYQCNSMTSVYIPSSVTEIGEEAFDLNIVPTAQNPFNIYIFSDNVKLWPWAFNIDDNDTLDHYIAWVMNKEIAGVLQKTKHFSGKPTFFDKNINLMKLKGDVMLAGKGFNEFAGLSKQGRSKGEDKGKGKNEIIVPSVVDKILPFAFSECSKNLEKITIENSTKVQFEKEVFDYVPKGVKYYVYSDKVRDEIKNFVTDANVTVLKSSQLGAAGIVGITVGALVIAVVALGLGIGLPMRKQHKINILNTKLNGRRIEKLSAANAMAFKKVIETTGALDQKVDKLTSGMMALKAASKKAMARPVARPMAGATTRPATAKVAVTKTPVNPAAAKKSTMVKTVEKKTPGVVVKTKTPTNAASATKKPA